MPRHRRRPALSALLVVVALVSASCSGPDDDSAAPTTTEPAPSSGGPTTTRPEGEAPLPVQDAITIEVVSSQPDRVSGPEARIRVVPERGGSAAELTVELDGTDVTGQLTEVDGRLEGVVSGLVEGTNTLVARAGDSSMTQRIRSWPISGPVISGDQTPLAACSTEAHGLGAPTDDRCSAPTRVTWSYIGTDGAVHDLPDPDGDRPADLATATIDGRDEVPLFVRHETGVINRSVYELATIDATPGSDEPDDPSADDGEAGRGETGAPVPAPGGIDLTWNRRLVHRFGDGCGATFGQGSPGVEALSPAYLARGYAVATASFTTGAVQCNDVVAAETLMMVKERVIELAGRPEVTVGEGRGFGSAQVHLIAQNYPGLLDAGIALDPLPDVVTVLNGALDCGLLAAYYDDGGAALTPEQRTAVNGHATERTCTAWNAGYRSLVDPVSGCDPAIPADRIYDAATNPGGIRCTLQDLSITQFGRDEETGHALRLLDNVGVQYGLDAFNAGTISFEQFADLNEQVGGYDRDGVIGPARHAADPLAVQTAYESGRVSAGTGDQRDIPIIDVDLYDDPTGSPLDRFRAFSLRDRLTLGAPPASVPGFQVWTRDPASRRGDGPGPEALAVVDEWATGVVEDRAPGDRYDVLVRTRPDEAVDNCIPDGADDPASGPDVYDRGPCRDQHPISGDPRIAAGAPLAADVIKCRLKAVDPIDYERSLSRAQFDRLASIFVEGVCDWSSPGEGQTVPSMPDRTYADVETPADRA